MAGFIKLSAPLFCLIFFSSLLSQQTLSQPQHMYTFCEELPNNFTKKDSYISNRETLLSSLRERSSLGTYSNATIGLSPDTVYGMYLCRGDINKTSCSDCVNTATLEITKNNCTYQKNAFIFYRECMVRYSNVSFFGIVEDRPWIARYSNVSFPNSLFNKFQARLSKKVEELIILTASESSSKTPYYVRDRNRVNDPFYGSYTLDIMVQCSPDLDPANCGVCLRLAVQEISTCCNEARFAHIFLPKCFLRYDTTGLPIADQSPTGSSSTLHVMKGNGLFGRIIITAMATSLLALVGL